MKTSKSWGMRAAHYMMKMLLREDQALRLQLRLKKDTTILWRKLRKTRRRVERRTKKRRLLRKRKLRKRKEVPRNSKRRREARSISMMMKTTISDGCCLPACLLINAY